MSHNDDLKFDSKLAAQTLPELEQTVKELQECLARLETLHEKFSRDFLKLFKTPEPQSYADHPAWPALRNVYFFVQANLAGNALSHLTYAADSAHLACGLVASLSSPGE